METWQHYEHGEQCKHTLTKEPRVLGRADGMTQTIHTSAMFTKQGKFKMKWRTLKTGVLVNGDIAKIAQKTMQPTLWKRVFDAQRFDEHFNKVWSQTGAEKPTRYSISSDGVLQWQDCLCIPRDEEILKDILAEAHHTFDTFHLGCTKLSEVMRLVAWEWRETWRVS